MLISYPLRDLEAKFATQFLFFLDVVNIKDQFAQAWVVPEWKAH